MLRAVVNERIGYGRQTVRDRLRDAAAPSAGTAATSTKSNGGNDGAVVPAYGGLGGNQPDNALARGYATLSSDSGHNGEANRDAGPGDGPAFALDHQARLNYGYMANVTLTPLAKTIIERDYGRDPSTRTWSVARMAAGTRSSAHAVCEGVRRHRRRRAGLQPAANSGPKGLEHPERHGADSD